MTIREIKHMIFKPLLRKPNPRIVIVGGLRFSVKCKVMHKRHYDTNGDLLFHIINADYCFCLVNSDQCVWLIQHVPIFADYTLDPQELIHTKTTMFERAGVLAPRHTHTNDIYMAFEAINRLSMHERMELYALDQE